MKTGWEMPQGAFDKMLAWLDPDRDSAGEKYEAIRSRLIKILAYRGCFEAEDMADETINRVVNKIDTLIENYDGDPSYYFLGVANNVHREFLKKPRGAELPDQLTQPEPVHINEKEKEFGCLENCLKKLPNAQRGMLLDYYRGDRSAKIDNRKKLAESGGISVGALHVKVFRLRAEMQKCVTNCLNEYKGAVL
jgi:DNA-directed RNA polymerase specialized sigma24 family protein